MSLKGKLAKSGKNNPMYGKHLSEKTRILLREQKLGEKNPAWKGNGAGYASLHYWINRYKPKPKKCEGCGKIKRLDAANISGKYLRDIKDYKWLCRKCHQKSDGRYKRLKFGCQGLKSNVIS